MDKFFEYIDKYMLIRRVMTLGTFATTIWAIWWAMLFAMDSTRPGTDVAMIIGAVLVPVNSLQGYMFGSYSRGREA